MNKSADLIKQIIKYTCDVDFNIIEKTDKDISNYVYYVSQGLFTKILDSQKDYDKLYEIGTEYLYEVRTILDISFMVFSDEQNRLYILGPYFTSPFSKTEAMITLSKHHIPETVSSEVVVFCKRVPVVSEYNISNLGVLLLKHFRNLSEGLPYKVVEFRRKIDSLREIELPKADEPTKMRLIEMRYENSAALTEAVKQGNFSLAVSILSRLNFEAENNIRNKNPLRNIQNYCIVMNTQLRHALEGGTIHPYTLDRFSNEIGIKIESLQTVEEANRYTIEIIRKYCDLVKETSYPDLKPLVSLAVTYIKSHLADNLSVKEMARVLSVNADYLSNRFVKEMGLTFTDFLNRERVSQAQGLLKNTALSIQEIASFVGYNNMSYFAKQFSRIYGLSPSEYRNGKKTGENSHNMRLNLD